jgi:hypothetical protein
MQNNHEGGAEEGIKICPKCGLPITKLYKNRKGDKIYYIAYHRIDRRRYRLCYLGPEEYKYGVRARSVLETSKNVGGMELKLVRIDDLKFLVAVDEMNRSLRDLVIQDFAEAIRSNIEAYGVFPIPIHVSSDGYVIDGIARVEAARKLGIKELPAIVHKIECSRDRERCLMLRLLLHIESPRIGYNELQEMVNVIHKHAREYLGTFNKKSRKELLEELWRYRNTRQVGNEELLRPFFDYMMKKTGLPPSTIAYYSSSLTP